MIGKTPRNMCGMIQKVSDRGAESWWGCFDSDSGSDSELLIGSDSGSDSDPDSDSGSDTKYKINSTLIVE